MLQYGEVHIITVFQIKLQELANGYIFWFWLIVRHTYLDVCRFVYIYMNKITERLCRLGGLLFHVISMTCNLLKTCGCSLKRSRKFQPEDRLFSLSSVTSPAVCILNLNCPVVAFHLVLNIFLCYFPAFSRRSGHRICAR